MKLCFSIIILVLLQAGCRRDDPVNGDYVLDIDYTARTFARASRPHFGTDHRVYMNTVKANLKKSNLAITIRYPKLRKSSIPRHTTTARVEEYKIERIDDVHYLLIKEGFRLPRREIPLLFNPQDHSLLLEEHRYILKQF